MKASLLTFIICINIGISWGENPDVYRDHLKIFKQNLEKAFDNRNVDVYESILSESLAKDLAEDFTNEKLVNKKLVINFDYDTLNVTGKTFLIHGDMSYVNVSNSDVFFRQSFIFSFNLTKNHLKMVSGDDPKSFYLKKISKLGQKITTLHNKGDFKEIKKLLREHNIQNDQEDMFIYLLKHNSYYDLEIINCFRGVDGVEMNFRVNEQTGTIVFPWLN